MKRSEMLNIMEDCVVLGRIYELNSRDTVDSMLRAMELHGMLPPHTIITGSKDEMEGHIQNCQWEPEDA